MYKKVCCTYKVAFLLIRPIVFSPFSLPSPLSITRLYILFEETINIISRASLLALAKSIYYISVKRYIVTVLKMHGKCRLKRLVESDYKAAGKRTQQLPTLLRQQCWQLLRACWQRCANGCNNSQQCWDLQCIVGRIQPISLCKRYVMSVRRPNNVGRAVQTDPTLLRYASAITEHKKCWELLAEKFDQFQTLRNNTQQSVQTDATCNIQQCWELLAINVASVCTGLK